MEISGDCQMLRLYIGENERHEGKPLYEAIVQKVEDLGGAGVTVLRGIHSFGAAKHIHKTRPLQYSDDLPIIIQIIDKEERIGELLKALDPMVPRGLITQTAVKVIAYRHEH
jgi:PII-like signaling protein